MRVTRLKKGYTIRLSDSEFEVMRALIGDMLAGEIEEGGLTPSQVRGAS